MARTAIWSVLVFVVFAFATAIVFFWIRDGSLREAGASMDKLLSHAGLTTQTAGNTVDGANGDGRS